MQRDSFTSDQVVVQVGAIARQLKLLMQPMLVDQLFTGAVPRCVKAGSRNTSNDSSVGLTLETRHSSLHSLHARVKRLEDQNARVRSAGFSCYKIGKQQEISI